MFRFYLPDGVVVRGVSCWFWELERGPGEYEERDRLRRGGGGYAF